MTRAWPFALAMVVSPAATTAQTAQEVRARLHAEETDRSEMMRIMHHLTDVHGPRLTGSPQLRRAQDWAVRTMRGWGLANVHLEAWDFGRPGWSNQVVEASVTAPYQAPAVARALAWTPSTRGLVTARAVLLLPPGIGPARPRRSALPEAVAMERTATAPLPVPVPAHEDRIAPLPTRAELAAYLDTMRAAVRDAIVLVGPEAAPPRDFMPSPLRHAETRWAAQFAPSAAQDPPPPSAPAPASTPSPIGRMSEGEVRDAVNRFLVANGALARVDDAGERRGLIRAQHAGRYGTAIQPPTVMMANADYGRIARTLRDGTPVMLRLNVANRFHPEGRTQHNVIAELPGTDRAGEVVMLGAHLDSWAGGTGATDDGAGVGIMMEAMRLIAATGLRPRRTIRIALWSGEEQGPLGSRAYVERHFGTAERPMPAHATLAAYVNIDTGTGRPRGATVFGPSAAARMVDDMMAGFRDWGFVGADASRERALGGSDTGAFYLAGLPGIGLYQDPFDYSSTHHTNFDTYEELHEPDLRVGAVEVAALALALANADRPLPRFRGTDMPPPDFTDDVPDRLLPVPNAEKSSAK